MRNSSLLFLLFLCASPLWAKSENPNSDQCEFIRQGLWALPASGGTFVIPEGTYTCSTPVILDHNHIALRGQGHVVLKLAANSNSPVIVMGDVLTPPRPLLDLQISNLDIDGNRLEQTTECWGGACDSGGTALIRNNGITVRGVTGAQIHNVHITGCRSGGVVTEKGCYDLLIDGLTSVDNHFDGFAGYETSRSVFRNLILSHNQAAGISLDLNFNANSFSNVRLEHNGDVGIFMRDSSFNLFENFVIDENGNHGIFLARGDGNPACANANEFANLAISNSRGYGFRLNDDCPGNRLSGKSVFKNNRDGCISQVTTTALGMSGSYQCDN